MRRVLSATQRLTEGIDSVRIFDGASVPFRTWWPGISHRIMGLDGGGGSSIKYPGTEEMSSRPHQDVEYIPLDSGPSEPGLTRRPVASAKYAGHLFLAAVFFTGIVVGGGIGRWLKVPHVITTLIPPISLESPHYEPVVTLFDSFIDMCVSPFPLNPVRR
jgi:hypothetical protein